MGFFLKQVPVFLIFCAGSFTSAAQPGTGPFSENAVGPVLRGNDSSGISYTAFFIRAIFITGNKKTKDNIILRELVFKKEARYSLQDLVNRFEVSKNFLMNTALFHDVIISLKGFEGDAIDILVEVSERWYIFPLPYLKPADRNLNQWLFEQNAKLNRTHYGGKIVYNNITGRNDKLRMWLVTGYTRQASFSYDRPFIDNKMRWGMKIAASAGKTREVNYRTLYNKQQFLKDDNRFLYHFSKAGFEFTYRKAIRTRHRFGFNFITETIKDTIVALNPVYFPRDRKGIGYPEFYYVWQYSDLDYNPYPVKGYAAEFSLYKKGVNRKINLWQLSARASANWPLNKKSFINLRSFAALKLPFKQPFFNQQLLGYNDAFIQGYEYYVIDGVAGAYLKASLVREIFKWNIGLGANKLAVNKRVPFRFYGKIFGNAGYVHHPEAQQNLLSNRMLGSAGIGLDIVTFYDFVLKLEWSFNQLGQNGLFLHRRATF